jgi:hypothetical protein
MGQVDLTPKEIRDLVNEAFARKNADDPELAGISEDQIDGALRSLTKDDIGRVLSHAGFVNHYSSKADSLRQEAGGCDVMGNGHFNQLQAILKATLVSSAVGREQSRGSNGEGQSYMR